ncbi:GDYXXLXY domain-containing protein [Bacillus sp. DJP31]|uniref:GDYXXLXY domain-containing protein n=1 Tax=Bacillus sp. DJP31 TaxID=3409789 RepID=UPI003BB5E13D
MTKRLLFYMVILLQALFLVVMTASFYAIDAFGEQIKLKTEPFDPRDIFYGDYVILQYSISSVPKYLWTESELPQYGDSVYVVLGKEGDYHEVVSVSPTNPVVDTDQVVFKGKYMYEIDPKEMYIEYGIERYYVPEGTGKELEDHMADLEAHIRIAPWGQMKIEKVDRKEE